MVISDNIAIMNQGVIEQIGTAHGIYERPKSQFVAGFIGLINFIHGKIALKRREKNEWIIRSRALGLEIVGRSEETLAEGQEVMVSIRPGHIELFSERPDRTFNVIKRRVERMTYIGEYSDLAVKVGSADLRVHSPSHLEFRSGSHVYLSLTPELYSLLVH